LFFFKSWSPKRLVTLLILPTAIIQTDLVLPPLCPKTNFPWDCLGRLGRLGGLLRRLGRLGDLLGRLGVVFGRLGTLSGLSSDVLKLSWGVSWVSLGKNVCSRWVVLNSPWHFHFSFFVVVIF
jgi:hypothetical protein